MATTPRATRVPGVAKCAMTAAMSGISVDFQQRRLARVSAEAARRAAALEKLAVIIGSVMLVVMISYMFVGDRPFHPDLDAASEISPINRYVWIGLVGMALPVFALRRHDLLPMARAIWPILLLYAWFLVTTTWALDPAASTRRTLQAVFAMVACAGIVLGVRSAERIQWLVCVPCILIVTVDLLSWFAVPGIAMTPLGLQGMHSQKNELGQYSMYAVLACVPCALSAAPGFWRKFLFGGAGIALITLWASRSGTSFGLLMSAGVILPSLVFMLRQRTVVVAASLLVLLLVLVGFFALYFMWCGVNGADPMAPLAGVTFTRRTDLWAFLIQNIHLRPWGGSGFGSFWAIDPAVQPSINSGLWFGRKGNIAPEGHDAYLDLTATTGLIGAAIGLVVLVRAIIHAGGAVRAAPKGMPVPIAAFQLGLTLIVIGHSFTESTLFGPNSPLHTLFVVSMMAVERARSASKA